MSSVVVDGHGKASGDRAITLVDLLIILAAEKKRIAQMTAVVTAIVAIVVFLMPNRYTATARILPPQQNQSLSTALAGQLAGMGAIGSMAGGNLGIKNPNDLYVGMLKSQTVEDALVRRFDLVKVYRAGRVSDAEKSLEAASTIGTSKEGFISIAVEDVDKKRAASIANAYVEELKNLMQRVAVTEAGQRRVFFEQQVESARKSLAEAEQALRTTQEKTGVIQLDGQAKAIIESVVTMRARMAAKQVQVDSMKAFATDQNPDLILANQELAGMRRQLSNMESQQAASGDSVAIPTGKVPESGLEYVRRLRDVKYYESVFELLGKQYEVAKLDEARQGSVVQTIDPAVEPDRKSSPRRGLILAITGVLAFLGSCLCTLLAESVRRLKVVDPDQAERIMKLKELLIGHRVRLGLKGGGAQ